MRHPDEATVGRSAEALIARRDLLAARYAACEGDDGGSVAVTGGAEEFTAWLFAQSLRWRSLHSIRLSGPGEDPGLVVRALRNNCRIVDAGLDMVSIFDTERFPRDVLDLLAGQPVPYRSAPAPIALKIVDNSAVVLAGPLVDGQRSLMLLHDPTTLTLARAYWRAVLARSRSAADAAAGRPPVARELSPRQRAVAALLARDTTDEQAAQVLGVSVRTLRSDIAGLKRSLGVETRFAAGLELGRRMAGSTTTTDDVAS